MAEKKSTPKTSRSRKGSPKADPKTDPKAETPETPNPSPNDTPPPEASGSTRSELEGAVLRVGDHEPSPDDGPGIPTSEASTPPPAPETAGKAPPDPKALAKVTAAQVRQILQAQGLLLNQTIGSLPGQWLWSPEELETIAPALAKVANRSTLMRRVGAASDLAVVGVTATSYVVRNLSDQAEAAHKEPQEPEATTEEPAPESNVVDTGEAPPAAAGPPAGVSLDELFALGGEQLAERDLGGGPGGAGPRSGVSIPESPSE